GPDLTLSEVYEAAEVIYRATDQEHVNIIFGTVVDESMIGEVRITVLATGFDATRPERPAEMAAAKTEPQPAADAKAQTAAQPQKPAPVSAQRKPAEEPVTAVLGESELDIPAFLRRR
ncbi:MAG TPA: cell division protein FtsZ, partial [Armatimonadota bacterium]|nr:cell division protein FtsZ [Armatimonadota bacterium]